MLAASRKAKEGAECRQPRTLARYPSDRHTQKTTFLCPWRYFTLTFLGWLDVRGTRAVRDHTVWRLGAGRAKVELLGDDEGRAVLVPNQLLRGDDVPVCLLLVVRLREVVELGLVELGGFAGGFTGSFGFSLFLFFLFQLFCLRLRRGSCSCPC